MYNIKTMYGYILILILIVTAIYYILHIITPTPYELISERADKKYGNGNYTIVNCSVYEKYMCCGMYSNPSCNESHIMYCIDGMCSRGIMAIKNGDI